MLNSSLSDSESESESESESGGIKLTAHSESSRPGIRKNNYIHNDAIGLNDTKVRETIQGFNFRNNFIGQKLHVFHMFASPEGISDLKLGG